MNTNDILKATKEALDKAISEKKISQEMIRNLSPAIIETLKPVLQEIADNTKITKKDLLDVLSQAKFTIPNITVPEANVKVSIPEIKVPEANVKVTVDEVKVPEIKTAGIEKTLRDVLAKFKLPEAKVTVNVPKFDKMEWPEGNMPVEGLVTLKGVDRKNPLPVELRDADGNPIRWPEYIGGGGGGGRSIARIGGVDASAYASYMNADGRLKVSVETGGSGLTDSELRAAHLDVQQLSGSEDSVVVNNTVGVKQLSGATDSVEVKNTVEVLQLSGSAWSVSVNDAFRTTVASALINSDDRIRVSVETGGSGLTDAELRATAVPVIQVSGAADSVSVIGTVTVAGTITEANSAAIAASASVLDDWDETDRAKVNPIVGQAGVAAGQGDTDVRTLRVVQAGDSISSVSVTAIAAGDNNIGNVDIVTMPAVVVTSITNSIAANVVDSGGIPYTTTNPLPVGDAGGSLTIDGAVTVNGATNSVIASGLTLHDAADVGDSPLKIGGVAMQTNPTAVADGDRVRFTADDLGRQLVRTVQVRDLTKTAYVSIANGTETTLRAAVAGAYLDLIYLMGSNNSDVAVTVDIRAVTAGNVMMTLQIPANGVAGVSLPVPIPQQETGNNWTADLPDVTGTTVYLSALFSQEI